MSSRAQQGICTSLSSRAQRGICTLLLTIAAAGAEAQSPGSLAADRARLAAITGQPVDSAPRSLIARPVPRRGIPYADSVSVFVLQPELLLAHNSAIPWSPNDGPLWAGRGWNALLIAGGGLEGRVRNARVRLIVAPALTFSQNQPFQVLQNPDPSRSAFANPFHPEPSSADLPIRFGDLYLLRLDPGRTELSIASGAIEGGFTMANQVWGPALRAPLVMSANAPGVPRFFLRTREPIRTRIGIIDAQMLAGTLTESRFFDFNPLNEYRSLSGVMVSLRPAFDSNFTLGVERVVYAPVRSSFLPMLAHSFDALVLWEYMHFRTDTTSSGQRRQRADQLMGVFARWIVPEAGFEVYGEYARADLPKNLTELLIAAHHTGGYTLGFQWAQPRGTSRWLRLQSEITYLEQSQVFADRPQPDFYTGIETPQGLTHRGQVLGAWTGPGSSSQFIGIDWLERDWQAGWFVGRVRWENDALYRQPIPNFFKHDVTVYTGLRGAMRTPFTDISAEATFGYRFNYLFQYGGANPGGFRTVDIRNFSTALRFTPR